ncbi:MAG: hypothetical protein AB1757_23835 [Acidobacteriota bacterium]
MTKVFLIFCVAWLFAMPISSPRGQQPATESPVRALTLRIEKRIVEIDPAHEPKIFGDSQSLLESCWYVTDNNIGLAKWSQELSSESYLLLAYAKPIEISPMPHQNIRVSEFLWLLPGRILVRDKDRVVAIDKCDGYKLLRLICRSSLSEYLPESYKGNCRLL